MPSHSLQNSLSFGLFCTTSLALVAHKVTVIWLNKPFAIHQLLLASPFLFAFDISTTLFLRRGLISSSKVVRAIANGIALFLTIASAVSVSYSFTARARIDWRRTAEVSSRHKVYNVPDIKVITHWQYYRRVMAQGNSSLFQVLAGYVLVGLIATFARLYFERHRRLDKWGPREKKRFYFSAYHLNVATAILVLGAMLFLSQNPWRIMRSTLLFDTLSIFNFRKAYVPSQSVPTAGVSGARYNPSKDPYYISNLDEPVDPFIASALEGTEFKNIVHIMLESMRSDSFPWDENGLLHQHLQEFMEPPQIPLTVENITPFIESIAPHTLRWDTMWSTIPYTLKAMLGRTSPYSKEIYLTVRSLWNGSRSK